MRRPIRIKLVWVWTLLALVLSYSLDLECVFEQHSCRSQVVHQEPGPDCAQPGIAPMPVALLPGTLVVTKPVATVVAHIEAEWAAPDLPRQGWRPVPLGLRAPPAA